MATDNDLLQLGFTPCKVTARELGIDHVDPHGRGPFCRLTVEDTAPLNAGVYAWAVNESVMYVGKARVLRQITQGVKMARAYNDYTYMPPSKVGSLGSPRVRVNGLLNAAMTHGDYVTWWWVETPSEILATALEAELINNWTPEWNRTRPVVP